MQHLLPVLACIAVAGCTAPPVQPPPATSFPPLVADEFPGAASLLDGFDARSEEAQWLAHDRALFGLRLDRDGEVVRWLLLIEAPLGQQIVARSPDGDEFSIGVGATAVWRFGVTGGDGTREIRVESRLATVRAKVFTAAGELLTDTEASLPVDLLGRGVLPAIDSVREATAAGAAAPVDGAWIEGVLAVRELLDIVRENDALADYFWQVVEKPSLWSVVTSLGVSVAITTSLEQSVPADTPPPIPPAERTFSAPLSIRVNGAPALFVDLLATDPRRPFALCGGIIAAIARHPTRPDTTFRMQLLAARLGAAEAKPGQANGFVGSKPGDEREVAGVKLCWCPAGRFLMGSPPTEPERRPGEDQVEVTLTRGFWIGKYETTQGQWKRVLGQLPGPLTAELLEGDDYPVGNVNFGEAEVFCQELTELGRRTGVLPEGWEFRLPTDAQWEYACRAGTTTATHFGDQLSSRQANFKGKPYRGAEQGPSLDRATRVGSYPANAWGLHDMHGNIFEWCRDWYHRRLPGGADPDLHHAKATATPSEHGDVSRVRRGGCWSDDGWALRTAFRLRFEPERRYDHIGFRVVVVQR